MLIFFSMINKLVNSTNKLYKILQRRNSLIARTSPLAEEP